MSTETKTIVFFDLHEVEESLFASYDNYSDVKFYATDELIAKTHKAITRLPSDRNYTHYRPALLAFWNKLFELKPLEYRNLDIQEACEFPLLFEIEKEFYPFYIGQEILQNGGGGDLIWYSEKSYPAYLEKIWRKWWRTISGGSLTIYAKEKALRTPSRWRLRIYAKRAALKQFLLHAPWKKRTKATTVDFLLVENYPNSVRLSLKVGEGLYGSGYSIGLLRMRPFAYQKPAYPIEVWDMPSVWNRQNGRYGRIAKTWLRSVKREIETSLPQEDNILYNITFPIWAEIFSKWFREAANLTDYIHAYLDRHTLRGIISTSYAGVFGRVAAIVGRQRSVPTHYLQHGSISKESFLHDYPFRYVHLWGKYNVGLAAPYIKDTSELTMLAPVNIELRERKIQAHYQAPNFVFFASRIGGAVVSEAGHFYMLTSLVNALHKLDVPLSRLILKVHPGDYSKDNSYLTGDRPIVVIRDERQVEEVLDSGDIAVIASSSVGLEVASMGNPIINVNFTGYPELVPYGDYNAAWVVNSPKQLTDALNEVLHFPEKVEEKALGQSKLLEEFLAGSPEDILPKLTEFLIEAKA